MAGIREFFANFARSNGLSNSGCQFSSPDDRSSPLRGRMGSNGMMLKISVEVNSGWDKNIRYARRR